MDYEKAYKNLVAKVKNAHLYAQTDSTKNVLEDILPELRESEDERIRKGIVETIKQCPDTFLNPKNRDRMLAYLEKQKEQKPSEIDFEDWDTLGYIRDIVRMHVKREEEFNVLDKWLTEHYVNQKSAEWSEEDEAKLRHALFNTYAADTATYLLGKLKSLRPSWKPSEEQMKTLAIFANLRCVSRREASTLESLYNDLQKLL